MVDLCSDVAHEKLLIRITRCLSQMSNARLIIIVEEFDAVKIVQACAGSIPMLRVEVEPAYVFSCPDFHSVVLADLVQQ